MRDRYLGKRLFGEYYQLKKGKAAKYTTYEWDEGSLRVRNDDGLLFDILSRLDKLEKQGRKKK